MLVVIINLQIFIESLLKKKYYAGARDMLAS